MTIGNFGPTSLIRLIAERHCEERSNPTHKK